MTPDDEAVMLLPCPNPWCASGVKAMPFAMRDRNHRVICGCDFKGPARGTRAEAIAAWNTRLTPAQPQIASGEIERLREALERCAKIVEQNLYRQHEKIEDVPRIARAALTPTGDAA